MAGEPFASYQSAARRCSFGMIIGFGAIELPEQELTEQGVVPVPASSAVERDEEGAGRLEPSQLVVRVRPSENGIAERCAQLLEHRGASQEPLGGLGQLRQ